MAAVIVPARAGVLSAVGLLYASRPARPGAVVADARRPRRVSTTARATLAAEARGRRRRRRADVEVATVIDCRYAGQSHELTVASVDDFHDRAPAPQRLRPARTTPIEVVALRATGPPARRPSTVGDLPRRRTATGGAGPVVDRRARLHRLGARRLAGRAGCRPAPWSCGRGRS